MEIPAALDGLGRPALTLMHAVAYQLVEKRQAAYDALLWATIAMTAVLQVAGWWRTKRKPRMGRIGISGLNNRWLGGPHCLIQRLLAPSRNQRSPAHFVGSLSPKTSACK